MDRRFAAALALGLALGVLAGVWGSRAADAQGRTTARTELVTLGLAECGGKEVRMYTTEIGPGVITPRHAHPGVYLVYVLEGSGTLERDDKPPLELRPGVSYAIDGMAALSVWHARLEHGQGKAAQVACRPHHRHGTGRHRLRQVRHRAGALLRIAVPIGRWLSAKA